MIYDIITVTILSVISSWELKLARNEIYAIHGRLFK
ncbi:YARHG domain-containing protein [Terrisporobacter mayombei]|nr:YARHG domain-containing protein [Terrisporobacter mayombei]